MGIEKLLGSVKEYSSASPNWLCKTVVDSRALGNILLKGQEYILLTSIRDKNVYSYLELMEWTSLYTE